MLGRWCLAAIFAVACGSAQPKARMSISPLAADAVAGITDKALAAAVAAHWDYMMRWSPTYATTLGDHRFDDQLAPRDVGAIDRANAERDALIAQLAAIDSAALTATDRVTLALLRGQLAANRAMDVCKLHEWLVDSGGSSLFGELSYLVEAHTVKTARDAQNLVARLRQGERAIDDTVANLSLGLAHRRVTSRGKLARAIAQLDDELAKPIEQWSMLQPAWAKQYPEELAALHAVVATQLRPALIRLRDFLRDRVQPVARQDHEGIGALPDGDACYRAAILTHVGLAMPPAELHALGLAEIARTDRELAALGAKVLGTADLASTIVKLRTDKALYFTSREEILAAAQHALDRATAAIPAYFSVLPKTHA